VDAIDHSKIKFIVTRHEQGAAFMADVYGRLTGKAGVCLSTLGPGATNLITGVANAHMDRSPLIAITGQGSLTRAHKESHQFIDQNKLFDPITKWTVTAKTPDTIPEAIRKSFKIAESEKPGAVHVELPEDVADMPVKNIAPLKPVDQYHANASQVEIDKAIKLIKKAKRPLILAGNGVIRQKAAKELRSFLRLSQIPAGNTFMAKGAIPRNYKHHLYTFGLQARDLISCVFEQADLIIAIGYDVVEYAPSFWNIGRLKKIIHIDSRYAEIDTAYEVDAEIAGHIGDSLNQIIGELKKFKFPNYSYHLPYPEYIKKELTAESDDTYYPLKPQKIVADIQKFLGDDDILISDVGAHKVWIARHYLANKPNTCLIANGFAAMGFALPGAIMAKMLNPQKKVLAVAGDGGFMMNVQELETAVRLKTPIVVLVWTDSKYGLIQWHQEKKYKHAASIDFDNPDFIKLAESFGAVGYKIKKGDSIADVLDRAFKQKKVAIIDCPVNYLENLKLTKKLSRNVCLI